MNRHHELAARYDRLRHELDALPRATGHDASSAERLIALLDQSHADYVAACRAAVAGNSASTHSSDGHPPSMVQATGEGPAQPGALPAHWDAR